MKARKNMWKQKLGISVYNNYKIPTTEVVKMVKQIGFDAISPEWDNDEKLNAIVTVAKEHNVELQSLHAPYGGAADMWKKSEDVSIKALNELLIPLEACKKYNIPVMVVHTWIGFDDIPAPTKAGLDNYSKLVSKATEYGVKIAFENTEGLDHLEALMEHFKDNDTVGFCWDSGHEMCYNHSKDLLAKFGDRLIMTHLNDNLGISRYDGTIYWTDDLHILPFDGVANWDYNVERLKKSNRLEILNFELNIRPKPNRYENAFYEKMTYEEYFTEAYKRACKIAYKLNIL